MGRTDNWGEAPLTRAKHLIQFLLSYKNHERNLLYAEWRKEDSKRPELYVRTTLLELALLLNPDRIKSRHEDKAKKEKSEIQNTIDRLKKLGIVEEDDSKPGEKSKDIRNLKFILWHSSKEQENLTQLQLAWGNRSQSEKSKIEKIASTAELRISEASKIELDPKLEILITTYLSKSFSKDKFAELDQAGEPETGSDHRTNLREVFIDLDLQLCERQTLQSWRQENFSLSSGILSSIDESPFFNNCHNFSAMKCLLCEELPKIVVIGTPGQGKSTLGQQLAQVYRAKRLSNSYEFTSQVEVKRIPFRVELKYFAQWLSNNPNSGSLESYLAEDMGTIALRPEAVTTQNLQDIFLCHASLLILDGLDEVVDSELQERMLAHIYDFLDWAENLNVNLKVVATSRPNRYKDQFDPKRFVHFELYPLSSTKVKKYANQWLSTRNLAIEEQNRIRLTLAECQKDEGIAALLKTPLQVTIILLIIKNGGRPPSEREALFNKYWNTILNREKSKDKNIIKSDDNTLLNLHAYLGYILHCRAADENIKSLLTKEEFRQFVVDFLRKRDRYSSSKDISAKVEQFVSDAKDRLVLIVAPQTGLFGFELRLFQEFFAAVYLFKTAKRFEHLKTIACSEHWHYVALFLAGRIVRELGDEADAILRQVCRSIDRPIDNKEENHYLRPGAWFALAVAADGSLSKDYRDHQYEAIEYGLEVLETGLTEEQQHKLNSLTGQLSDKDQRDLLRPALEGKLRSKDLPETCWQVALNLYGQHFSSKGFFQERINALLETPDKNLVLSALNLALRYKSEPLWMLERLQHHWSYWIKNISEAWFYSSRYTEKLLNLWSLSEVEATELAEAIFESPWRWQYSSADSKKEFVLDVPELKTFSEQLILLLRCIYLIRHATSSLPSNRVEINWIENEGILSAVLQTRMRVGESMPISIPDEASKALNNLLRRSDLIPQLRVSLWTILLLISQPNLADVSNFFESFSSSEKISTLYRKLLPFARLKNV
jgi:adenylate kinase family enzyme